MGFRQGYTRSNPISDQFSFEFSDGSKNSEDQPSVWSRSINPLMQTDEIDPKGPELFERIDQLAQTPGESVVAINYDAVHCSTPTISDQLIQRRPVFLRPAGALIKHGMDSMSWRAVTCLGFRARFKHEKGKI